MDSVIHLLNNQWDFLRIFRGQWFSLFAAAGHVEHGKGVFKNFAPAGQFVLRQKKVCLVHRVGYGHVQFRLWNAPRRGQEDLPEHLLKLPLFCDFVWYFCGFGKYFDRGNNVPVAPGAVLYLCEFGIHRVTIRMA